MLVNINSRQIKKTWIIQVLLSFLFIGNLKAQILSLDQCIDTALQSNRNIKLSQQDIYFTKEKNREAISNLFPKLNGIGDYRYYTDLPYQFMPASAFGGPVDSYKEVQFGVTQNLNANVQLNLPIYNPIAISAIKSTKVANELSEIQRVKTEEDVALEVSNAYYNAQILLNQIAFLDSNIMNTDKLVQTTFLLYQQQLAKETDVDRLKLQLEQVNTQRSSTFSKYQQILNVLKFLMGKPITDTIEVILTEKSITEVNFHINRATDILLINKKLELDYSELKGLRYSRFPIINVYGIYGTMGYGNTGVNSFFKFHPIGYVGAQLSVPLFSGMVNHHKIVQKKIEIEKTIIQKDLVAEKNNLEIKNAEMQYQEAIKNVETVAEQIKLAKKIYDNTILQNKQGIASITDLLLTDSALRDAQQSYIVALINLHKAELEYKRVTGNLLSIKTKKYE